MYWCWSDTNKRREMSFAVDQKRGKEVEWVLVSMRNEWKGWAEHFCCSICIGIGKKVSNLVVKLFD